MGACVAAVLACAGLGAAQASAATIVVGQACVVNPDPAVGSPMTVTGAGFGPGDMIDLTSNKGGAFGTTTAGPTGGFTITMPGPILPTVNPAAAAFVLTANDGTNAALTASTNFDAANLAVATNPLQAKPSKKVTWTFSGFIGGAEIYAHYLHGKKVTATTKFGRAQGPCGVLKKKAVFYPGKAKYNSYKVQVDDTRRYSLKSLPHWIATLRTHIPM
ncbi:MAG TPA: hypothetical protein VG186_18470 [Solirubrobacteraceae bacterium]|nr:hypothetical protein [Solirubrobacteraceae bacterium]